MAAAKQLIMGDENQLITTGTNPARYGKSSVFLFHTTASAPCDQSCRVDVCMCVYVFCVVVGGRHVEHCRDCTFCNRNQACGATAWD